MKKIPLKEITREYKNNGQHAEQVARYTLTGVRGKADNIPFWKSGDIGLLQVKSAKATICKGSDIDYHLTIDKANSYGYITKDFKNMYVMAKEEYKNFVESFGYITRESTKNGKGEKIRLKDESKKMLEWLNARVQPLTKSQKLLKKRLDKNNKSIYNLRVETKKER